MILDIYKSQKITNLYIFVPININPNIYIPDINSQYGELTFIKSREVLPGEKLIGTNAEEILQNISRAGFHIQSVIVPTQVSEGGAAIGGGILGASVGGPIGALIGAFIGYAFAEHAKKVQDEL